MLGSVISKDGSLIAYEQRGSGPGSPLVFVHGWSCSRRHWSAQMERFAEATRVVAVDLAGHGESSSMRQAWTIESFGEDVAAVVLDLDLRDVILIGHSLGADACVEAALLLAGRVRGLIWVDQHTQLSDFRTEAEVHERVVPFRENFDATTRAFVRGLFASSADRALVERVCEEMASAPRAVAVPLVEATWNYARRVPDALAALRLPVVAINAESPPTDVDSLQRCGVRVLLLPGMGHFPMLERPEEFDTLLAQAIQMITLEGGLRGG